MNKNAYPNLYRLNAATGEYIKVDFNYSDECYELVDRPYSIEIKASYLSDGTLVWVARHPELSGCMVQAYSAAEALLELRNARLDLIEHLLEYGFDVPEAQLDD